MHFLRPKGTLAAVATAAAAVLLPTTAVAPATAAAPAAPIAASPAPTATNTPTLRWVHANTARVTTKRAWASRIVARPDDGTRLQLLDRGRTRIEVRLPGGRTGWVSKFQVTATPLADATGTRFTTGRVALTKGPWSASPVVARARLGTQVKRLAVTTQSDVPKVKVRLPDGRTGWVRATRLTQRNVWGALAQCESGGNPRINTGNGYYGLYQFTASTWRSVGGRGLPHQNSAAEQTKRAQILQERAGWGQWPACTRRLGLR